MSSRLNGTLVSWNLTFLGKYTPFYPDGAVSTLRKGYWNNCTKMKANCNYLYYFVFLLQSYNAFLNQSNFWRIIKLH